MSFLESHTLSRVVIRRVITITLNLSSQNFLLFSSYIMLSSNDAAGDCGYTPVSAKFAVGPN